MGARSRAPLKGALVLGCKLGRILPLHPQITTGNPPVKAGSNFGAKQATGCLFLDSMLRLLSERIGYCRYGVMHGFKKQTESRAKGIES